MRLADRALRQVNPLLDVVARLLELAAARLTAAQVLDLLAAAPVRRRFGLDDGDLDRLRELAVGSGVRWGLDAAHRRPFKLEAFGQNTWSAGLDRLLLGVAMPGDAWLGTALPAAVEPGDTVRVGRLAEFVERLAGVLGELSGERPLAEWTATLTTGPGAAHVTTATDAWQAVQARAELAEAAHVAGPHAATVPLGLADVRSLLAERLRGRPTRAGFRTGTLTVATLVPMRSVPHRVVCLLGLDDGVFPRAGEVDGDDVLARRPLVGERDAAQRRPPAPARRDHGGHRHARRRPLRAPTSAPACRRPPAVPLGRAARRRRCHRAGRRRRRRAHPLQPFDARNFTAPSPFSFDRAELAGARAAAGPRAAPPPFLPAPLPPPRARHRAARRPGHLPGAPGQGLPHPARRACRCTRATRRPPTRCPSRPDGLATWAIGHRLLRRPARGPRRSTAAGRPSGGAATCRRARWAMRLLAEVLEDVEPLVAAAAEYRVGEAADRDVDVELPDGTRVVGTVGGLHGHTALRVEYSRLAPKQRLRSWVRLVALTAATDEPWRAVTVGRGRAVRHRAGASSGRSPPDAARAVLAELVALRGGGAVRAAAAVHRHRLQLRPGPPRRSGRGRRAGRGGAGRGRTARARERADPSHERVWGRAAPASVLSGEAGPPGGEPTRFGALALGLWSPLLQVEDVVRR